MKDPTVEKHVITLNDGVERTLLFDYEACAAIDELFPETTSLLPKFWATINAKKLPVIIWAGLEDACHREEGGKPEITLALVRKLMKGIRPLKLLNVAAEAWMGALPEDVEVPTKAQVVEAIKQFQ